MVLIRYLGRSGGHVKLMCLSSPSWVRDLDKILFRFRNLLTFTRSIGVVLLGHVLKMSSKSSAGGGWKLQPKLGFF